MAVADADYCFSYVHMGASGREHDNTVFNRSGLGQRLREGDLNIPVAGEGELPFCFVADEAFPLIETIMRPYPGRRNDGTAADVALKRQVYNYRVSRARRVVENAFGILVCKWRIFRQPIIGKLDTVDKIVRACCVLHNHLRRKDGVSNDRRYIVVDDIDREDRDGHIQDGAWRQQDHAPGMRGVGRMGSNMHSRAAAGARERFADFFMTEEGRLPWQEAVARRGDRD